MATGPQVFLMTTGVDFRLDEDYRLFVQRVIPRYMVNEIDPLVRGLPSDEYAAGGLVAVDIGAHTGIWSAALLAHSGPFLRALHLFEPMEGNVARIGVHRANGFYSPYEHLLTVNRSAVGKLHGTLTLNYDRITTFYASAAVVRSRMDDRVIELDKAVDVPVTTIDDYAERQGLKDIHLMKIDVEGLELDVLRGAEQMLRRKRIRSLIFEFGTHQMGRKEYFRDFWEFFADLGYTMHEVLTAGIKPRTIERYSVAYETFSTTFMLMATAQPLVNE